jgi:hypothetical protein
MNCRKAGNLLSAYLDRELKPGLRQRVRAHLEHCRACAREFDVMASISAQVASVPAHEPNEAFYRRLFERLWERRQATSLMPRLVFAVGTAAVAALLAFAVLRSNGPQQPGLREVAQAIPPAAPAAAAQERKPVPEKPAVVAAAPSALRRWHRVGTALAPRRSSGKGWVGSAASLPSRGTTSAAVEPAKFPKPTTQEIALVSEAIFRLREATSGASNSVQEAARAHTEPQIDARETLQEAFEPFRSARPTTFEVGNSHGF